LTEFSTLFDVVPIRGRQSYFFEAAFQSTTTVNGGDNETPEMLVVMRKRLPSDVTS
jgi:hypothetical protein